MTRMSALIVVLLALCVPLAQAQTTLHYREGQRVDAQDVRKILDRPAQGAVRTRSIRLLQDGTDAPEVAASALSLPVQFEFDSAAIRPEAREQLDALAQGIKLLPPQRRVLIEGHTDAVGTEEYNLQLSQRRAQAVKQYLVQQHGIAPQRLRSLGVGKQQPVPDLAPEAPENRRVQFRGA
ncbi:outer membrane protein/peptidoglycan-associated (lipo)protein [Burkholderiales bacterium JOSHI_001]|nr:outer membrane protein/peptidoglycan-associated (lipo)protein [Burkholderiales bacterium JOSHI_001]